MAFILGKWWSGNMADVKFYKVTVLPNTLVPNSFYYVENGNYAEAYLTDDSGVAKKIGNTQMIEELTLDINAGFFT
jgi:hypothetical protein